MRLPMQSCRHLMAGPILLLSLWAVSGCANQVQIQPQFPPAPDVEAATEAKPAPTPDIVTSARAAAEYNAAVELWGMRVQAAGVRVCLWLKERGGDYDCGG